MVFDWFFALSPIVVLLVLMLGFGWGAAKSGLAGWLAAILVAAFHFGAGLGILGLAQIKALLLSLDVLLIVWGAYLHYRVMDAAGSISVIGKALQQLTSDRGMLAILIGWVFASFLQGIGGFGVPVAVIAPLLIGLGFTPIRALIIPSLGHAWAVTFGSLASSFQALMAATDLSGYLLAPPAALLLGVLGMICGFMVVFVAEGKVGVRRLFFPVFILGLVMGVTQFALAANGLWNIAAFGAGMTGLLVGVPVSRWFAGHKNNPGEEKLSSDQILLSLSGFIILIVVTLLVQLVQPLRSMLGVMVISLDFPQMSTSLGYSTPAGSGRDIYLLRHTGIILGFSALCAYILYRIQGWLEPGSGRVILSNTAQKMALSSLGIVAMVGMAVIMAHAGMTRTLAEGLARAMGPAFPLGSSLIGALGAFITGSNTNSNVIFAGLQQNTAQILQISVPLILASQTAGGAIGSIIAPTKIMVGVSTAGMNGKEGLVIRSLLGYSLILILLAGLGVWVFL
jgi:lactate permease